MIADSQEICDDCGKKENTFKYGLVRLCHDCLEKAKRK